MNCSDVRDALESYIADDLTDAESARLAAHLAECDGCAAEYEHTREVVSRLTGVADAFVPRERYVPRPEYAPRPAGGWGWRIAAVAASVIAVLAVGAMSVPAIARQLPLAVAREIDALESQNDSLREQVDELTVRLETIGGAEVAIVDTAEGDLSAEENSAVQLLAMAFVRAQYAGDLDALAAMGTDRLRADLAAHPDDYLRAQGADVVFAQMTEAVLAEDGTYLVFVRLSDSVEWTDSQYQENFEIKRVGDTYLVDFMGMDA
ncbi:MAG: zf-HC2 domain-containing protein [Coriobacteriia bacterium]|nr:zf-HC2 domain-containing protein [Actinomycetota bacterium]MDZ4167412.1 zf-HC2 domain-containing protein [Coriobacteriia bacterium]